MHRETTKGAEKGRSVVPVGVELAIFLLVFLASISLLTLIRGSQPSGFLSGLHILALAAMPIAIGLWLRKSWAFYAAFMLLEALLLLSPLIIAFSPYFAITYNWIALLAFMLVGLTVLPLLSANERYFGLPQEMRLQKLVKSLPVFNVLFVICGLALIIRTVLPYDTVFKDSVRFASDDAVFHMRLVENALFGDHFPRRLFFDVYTYYPYGIYLHFAPLYDQIIIFATWMIGLGSPTKSLMETVGAYYPAILGALVVFPVYIIGRELHNRYAGLIAAVVLALLPGQFLSRSIIGFTDHHIGEVLFSTVAVMFLVLALKRAQESFSEANIPELVLKAPREWLRSKNLPFLCYIALLLLLFQVVPWEWWVFLSFTLFLLAVPIFQFWKRPDSYLFYSFMAGMALGFYLLTWVGGVLFVLIFLIFGVLLSILHGIRGEPYGYLSVTLTPVFLIPLFMLSPFFGSSYPYYNLLNIAPLGVGVITFALPLISQALHHKQREAKSGLAGEKRVEKDDTKQKVGKKREISVPQRGSPLSTYGFLLPLLTLAVVLGLALIVFPSLVFGLFGVLTPSGTALTIAEVHPMDKGTAWIWFTTPFYIALVAMLILARDLLAKTRPEAFLVLFWSIVMFVTVGGLGIFGVERIGQNRFAYYYAVNAALLSGLFFTKACEFLTGVEAQAADARAVKKGGKRRRSETAFDYPLILFALAIMILFFIGLLRVGIESFISLAGIGAIFFVWRYAANEGGAEKEAMLRRVLAVLVISAFVFYPFPLNAVAKPFPSTTNLPLSAAFAIQTAERGIGAEEEWYEALRWMRNNTPEPGYLFSMGMELKEDLNRGIITERVKDLFETNGLPLPEGAGLTKGKGDTWVVGAGAKKLYVIREEEGKLNNYDYTIDYYSIYEEPPFNATTGARENYEYPSSAYGVMSWWDYGHIITWIAHRIPNANPFQAGIGGPIGSGNPGACVFFIVDNETEANEVADALGVRYVISDFMMADIWNSLYNKYAAMTVWAGDSRYNTLSYYYRTIEARLHMFDGASAKVEGERIAPLAHYRLVHESPTFVLPFVVIDESTGYMYWRSFAGNYNTTAAQAEILHGHLFSLSAGAWIKEDLNKKVIPELLKDTFNSTGFPLSEESTVMRIREGRWTIQDELNQNVFLVTEEDGMLTVYLYGVRTGQPNIKAWTPPYIQPVSFVKVFEYVKGARITGRASSGSVIEVATTITTNQGRRFTYTAQTTAGETYELIVPYSTEGPIEGGTKFDVAVSPYRIRAGHYENETVVWDVEKEVRIHEEDVIEGRRIEVDLL